MFRWCSCLLDVVISFSVNEVFIERDVVLLGILIIFVWVSLEGVPDWKDDCGIIFSFWLGFTLDFEFGGKVCLVWGMEACSLFRSVGNLSSSFSIFSMRKLLFWHSGMEGFCVGCVTLVQNWAGKVVSTTFHAFGKGMTECI